MTKYLQLKNNNVFIIMLCGVVVITLYCFYTYHSSKDSLIKQIDQRLYQAAMGTEFLLHSYPEIMPSTVAITPDLYDSLTYELSEFAKHSNVAYVYSLDRFNGEFVYTSSSYSAQDLKDNHIKQYMEPYHKASEQLASSFNNFQSFYETSFDHTGNFRSLIHPVVNERGNTRLIIAKIRLVEIEQAAEKSLFKALAVAGYFLLFSVILAALYIYKMRASLLKDPTTGFANHLALNERLADSSKSSLVAVIGCRDLIDIGSFYGQNILDMCIKNILVATSTTLGKHYCCYRLSHSTVVVVAAKHVSQQQMTAALTALDITTPLLNSPVIYTRLQIGTAKDHNSAVLENAILAQAVARTEKKPIQAYSHVLIELKNRYHENILISGQISEAFEDNRIVPFFQPIVHTGTGYIIKYEALVRLINKDGTILPPRQVFTGN